MPGVKKGKKRSDISYKSTPESEGGLKIAIGEEVDLKFSDSKQSVEGSEVSVDDRRHKESKAVIQLQFSIF